MKQLSFLAACLLIICSACDSGPKYTPLFTGDSQQAIDDAAIIAHLKENGVDAQHTESGIYYTIETEGDGNHPAATDVVTCHYTGTLISTGDKFDSSYDRGQPTEFPLTGVIKGWQEGIPLLSKGGKGTLYIPSGLAYGARAIGGVIPANSVLKFEVELVDFLDQAEFQQKQQAAAAEQLEVDKGLIAAYVEEKGLSNIQYTESGMGFIIEEPGKGENPTVANTVVCHYRGTLLDGTEFDSSYSRGQPTEFPLSQVIVGWQEGIPMLKPGGKGTFVIPSGICYGPNERPSIPANSVLVFDVELVEVK
ncbi:MAG: FKBP-type peptidyl-prolyl cis-trans isomerase [Bacteroidota bacterium]